jgi:transcriptional regulator with XRE-family HTH domain
MASAPPWPRQAMGQDLGTLVRDRLRSLRKERGLTQEALCERAGISRDAVTRIEGGSRIPTIDTLERLAAGLGVSVSDLVQTSPLRRPKHPMPVRRVVALLEDQAPEVQDAAEEVIRALVRVARARTKRRP